jgi:hypothetical protein
MYVIYIQDICNISIWRGADIPNLEKTLDTKSKEAIAGRSFWGRPGPKYGCQANDDDDDDEYMYIVVYE